MLNMIEICHFWRHPEVVNIDFKIQGIEEETKIIQKRHESKKR
jgi:hypothetical protein